MTIDRFYKEIKDELLEYENTIVAKEFINKSTPIEEVPINIAKGKITAVKELLPRLETIYKKYKPHSNIE